ncbi:hypothetical protein JCM11641_006991 [Rhodosporidiobolus odoratus]
MIRSPLRGLRVSVKILVLAATVLCLYNLVPIFFPSSASSSAWPTSSTTASKTRPPFLELTRERSSWSAAHGQAEGAGTRDESDFRGEGWAPRGRAPPRRGSRPQVARPAPLRGEPPGREDHQAGDRGGTFEEEMEEAKKRQRGQLQRQKVTEGDERVAKAKDKAEEEAAAEGRHQQQKDLPRGAHAEEEPTRAGVGRVGADEVAGRRMERRPRLGAGRRRKKPAVGQEDTERDEQERELQALARGAPARKAGPPAARKKAPLVRVGGAENAAGLPDSQGRVERAAALIGEAKKGKADQWRGQGWDQRFRKQPVMGRAREEKH